MQLYSCVFKNRLYNNGFAFAFAFAFAVHSYSCKSLGVVNRPPAWDYAGIQLEKFVTGFPSAAKHLPQEAAPVNICISSFQSCLIQCPISFFLCLSVEANISLRLTQILKCICAASVSALQERDAVLDREMCRELL